MNTSFKKYLCISETVLHAAIERRTLKRAWQQKIYLCCNAGQIKNTFCQKLPDRLINA